MIRTAVVILLTASVAVLSGCSQRVERKEKADRVPQPPPQPPRPTDLPPLPPPRPIAITTCDGNGYYQFDFDNCTWVYHPNDGPPQPIQGNPPCTPDWRPDCNQVQSGPGVTREDLGLVPDADGKVAPQIWFDKIVACECGLVNLETRFDLSIATEATWQLPFDVDSTLYDAIGAQNIHAAELQIVDDGHPAPVLVILQGIQLRDALLVLTKMGIYRINTQISSDTFSAEISGDLKRVYLWKNDELLQRLDLQ